jgi:hypothetical protein
MVQQKFTGENQFPFFGSLLIESLTGSRKLENFSHCPSSFKTQTSGTFAAARLNC